MKNALIAGAKLDLYCFLVCKEEPLMIAAGNEDCCLMHGECIEMMGKIPSGSVDMVMCDLPYGSTRNPWDTIIPLDDLWLSYKRIVRKGGAIVLTASQPFTSSLVVSNQNWFKYAWVWEKSAATGHLNAKRMPMKLHEDVLVFSDGAHRYFPQGLVPFNKVVKRGGNGGNFGKSGTENFQEFTNYPRSILRYGLDEKAVHPTQKPVSLLKYLITTYSEPGETVLDNTMGSGSTGVASIATGRRFIGIEKDETYFNVARNRINNAKSAMVDRRDLFDMAAE